jgi:hypothetical protein
MHTGPRSFLRWFTSQGIPARSTWTLEALYNKVVAGIRSRSDDTVDGGGRLVRHLRSLAAWPRALTGDRVFYPLDL